MTLPTGRFSGGYSLVAIDQREPSPGWRAGLVRWITGGLGSPTLYRYSPGSDPLTYTAADGRSFVLDGEFVFDGATTPRRVWRFKDLSPWDWPKAALVHDNFFDQHHRGTDVVSFPEANRLLGEMCRTLGVSRFRAWLIVLACDVFGKTLWDHPS